MDIHLDKDEYSANIIAFFTIMYFNHLKQIILRKNKYFRNVTQHWNEHPVHVYHVPNSLWAKFILLPVRSILLFLINCNRSSEELVSERNHTAHIYTL